MDNEFLPYELALKLKELGFKEECLASYYHAGRKLDIYEYINHSEYTILAPLWQQAFSWFEEEHKLFSCQENVVLSFSVADCRNNNIKILKPITHEDTFQTKEEVSIARLEFLIKQIKNETSKCRFLQ